MKKICSFLLMFALLGAMVIAVVVPAIPAKAEEGPIWPCEGSQNIQSPSDVDKFVYLDPSLMGSLNTTFGWVGGCPAVRLKSVVPESYYKTYSIRIASDEVLGTFFISTEYDQVMGYPALDINSKFQLFVPDNRMDEFVARGLHPTPFSSIKDWSWENMLGASKDDTVAQWIGRNLTLGGVIAHRSEMVFGMVETSPNPANFFLTWREQEYNIYLPVIMH